MVVKAYKIFLQTGIVAALMLSAPLFAFAASTYGDCEYGTATYGGDCTPAPAPTPAPSGGGGVVGSGPTAPGYQVTPQEAQPGGAGASPSQGTGTATNPTTPTSPSATFSRDLELGSEGADVQQLQLWLNAQGYMVAVSGNGSPGMETTYFGPATQAALAKYQAAKGITPAAGYFGPKTRAAMGVTTSTQTLSTPTTPTTSASFSRDLEPGSEGEDVRALQVYLNTHGYPLANYGVGSMGNETTYFGNATKFQLSQLQAANGITPAEGYFGPKTRAFVIANQ